LPTRPAAADRAEYVGPARRSDVTALRGDFLSGPGGHCQIASAARDSPLTGIYNHPYTIH